MNDTETITISKTPQNSSIDNTNHSPDPHLVYGTNGFTIRKPFPYKNTQGDIFCIVCCLQKGELVFQPKANFKVCTMYITLCVTIVNHL